MPEKSLTFNILIKEEDDQFIAHCLELDIVTTANDLKTAEDDIASLVVAQLEYAFSNDNLENLYRPAPPEVWQEFWSCKDQMERRYPITPSDKLEEAKMLPPWLIANICQSHHCHA